VRTVNPSLILLILVWVALLLPGALRSRLRPSPRATVGGFQRTMDGLRTDRALPIGSPVPVGATRSTGRSPSRSAALARRAEDPVLVRRRTRYLRLLAATFAAVVLAVAVGGSAWLVAGALLATSAVATFVLRRLKLQRDAARSVLARLDLRRASQPLVDEITGELVLAAGTGGSVVRLRSWQR